MHGSNGAVITLDEAARRGQSYVLVEIGSLHYALHLFKTSAEAEAFAAEDPRKRRVVDEAGARAEAPDVIEIVSHQNQRRRAWMPKVDFLTDDRTYATESARLAGRGGRGSMGRRIKVDGILYEKVEDYPEGLVDKIVNILRKADTDALVSAWNEGCDWGDDPSSKIWPMDDFDDEFGDEDPREIAEEVWKSGKRFNPFASYFWYERNEGRMEGTLVTGNTIKDMNIDYELLAEEMIDAEDGFGISSIDRLF